MLPEANLLPAIAVVLSRQQITHFVLLAELRRSAAMMDLPLAANGRQSAVSSVSTSTRSRFREGEGMGRVENSRGRCDGNWTIWEFRGRLPRVSSNPLLDAPGWRALARLEAGTRSVGAIVRSGGLRRGREAERVLERLIEQAGRDGNEGHGVIPLNYWSAWPAPPEEGSPESPEEEERVFFKGAVLVHVKGAARNPQPRKWESFHRKWLPHWKKRRVGRR